MLLNDVKWKKFKIVEILGNSNNSKAYHSENLKFSIPSEKGIPYITRTNLNNGLFSIIKDNDYKINPSNTITLGAENAKYFYQPYPYITGNKMYYYNSEKINKYSGLFITKCLNDSIKKCGFGYGMGLTGTRSDKRNFMLPVNDNDEPNFEFMEEYIKNILFKEINDIKKYCNDAIEKIQIQKIEKLKDKKWDKFKVSNLFDVVIGKSIDGNKVDREKGNVAYITRKESNNALDGFINYNSDYKNLEYPVITIGNETAKPFVQTYPFFTGTKVNIMKPKFKANKYILFFISRSLEQHKNKYSYSYTINSTRLREQIILLPINDEGTPDYEYMEQYVKNIMYNQYKRYLDFLEN